MSVLVKGMNMPKNCGECPLVWVEDFDGDSEEVCVPLLGRNVDDNTIRPEWCPLEEVKWISAYNESPPIGTKVFVMDDKGRCGIGLLDTELDWWDQATGVLYAGTVTHWLPVPKEVEE